MATQPETWLTYIQPLVDGDPSHLVTKMAGIRLQIIGMQRELARINGEIVREALSAWTGKIDTYLEMQSDIALKRRELDKLMREHKAATSGLTSLNR